nr:MAG TPA: hypothetical protein [Caudoviricetes sp.]
MDRPAYCRENDRLSRSDVLSHSGRRDYRDEGHGI